METDPSTLKTKVTGSSFGCFGDVLFWKFHLRNDSLCNRSWGFLSIKVETFHRYFPHMFKERLELKIANVHAKPMRRYFFFALTHSLNVFNRNRDLLRKYKISDKKSRNIHIERHVWDMLQLLELVSLSASPLPKGISFFFAIEY